MSDYQVIARKFRPQSFKDVIGQDAIITTLKNAIKFNRLAQAYLFCGSRGTGKTTLARLLAKALNCQQPIDCEPCNQCSSCREITASHSLDVLEVDGASHRGIEDIRQINETVGYATASGHYKIYIIDEVHMLTKEAFNALLKTLEEPPPKVKFLFATTEPHKIPSTILSRCQRFNLNRIAQSQIVNKLRLIADRLEVKVEEEALYLLAQRAEGGLRDAESLFDQILAFEEGTITVHVITKILGLMPRDIYFEIDQAGKAGQFARAFEIVHQLFSEGKDPVYFIEGLIDHLRRILLIKVSGVDQGMIPLLDTERDQYQQTARLYSEEQCLDLIEYLLEAQNQLRTTAFSKIFLETILLHVMRSHFRLPIEQLVRHLSELERKMGEKGGSSFIENKTTPAAMPSKTPTSLPKPSPPPSQTSPSVFKPQIEMVPGNVITKPQIPLDVFVSEDPTPTPSDLGQKNRLTKPSAASVKPSPPLIQPPEPLSMNEDVKRPLYEYDTLLHFAAVELDGKLQKNQM